MCFVATALFASNFLSANYISDQVDTFMDVEYAQYSGLFVQADGLGYEGEKIQDSLRMLVEEQTYVLPKDWKELKHDDPTIDKKKTHFSRMGYAEFNDVKDARCYDL